MAFKSGLHNRVVIYPKQYNTQGDRTQMEQMTNQVEETQTVTPCRIIHSEKALFEPYVQVTSGDRFEDVKSGDQYEVLKAHKVYGKKTLHHLSCDIRLWGIDSDERQDKYSNRR